MKPVPEIGKSYYFFDDGKLSPSRCYIATVTEVIPASENPTITVKDPETGMDIIKSLEDIRKKEVDEHRQEEDFTVISPSADTKIGSPWLYAEKTDYFIKCSIPDYDENPIIFVRTVNGGWFSMDVTSMWQSGELDVDGSKYERMKKDMEQNPVYDLEALHDLESKMNCSGKKSSMS